MNSKLLRLKTIGSTEKLILMLMLDYPPILPIVLRAGDIAKDLGTTRKDILESISKLVDVGYITTTVAASTRVSKLTQEFKQLIMASIFIFIY